MCDFSRKLIAWLDQELAESEACEVGRHIENCAACQRELDRYRKVSCAFDAYCESKIELATKHKTPGWIRALSYTAAAGAIAAMLALLLLPRPAKRLQLRTMTPASHSIAKDSGSGRNSGSDRGAGEASTAAVSEDSLPMRKPRQVHVRAPMLSPDSPFVSPEREIQIAIPADAMFPPGAMPPGVTFTGDFNVAPDGSVQRLQLQPRLIEMQRRSSKP